jgi:hypothetical protein
MGLDLCNASDVGSVLASTSGTHLANGVGNAYGPYVQIVASTATDCCWVIVHITFDGGQTGTSTGAIKIAIGAAGSEKDVVVDLQHWTNALGASPYTFPLNIPAGTRISVAGASGAIGGASHMTVKFALLDGGFTQIEGASGLDSIGYDATNIQGTPVTPGATASTKGSYSQLVASTTRDYIGFVLVIDNQNNTGGGGVYAWDIAIGAGGSEQIIVPNFFMLISGISNVPSGPFWINIPAGTRISARNQKNASSAAAAGVTLYGIYQ